MSNESSGGLFGKGFRRLWVFFDRVPLLSSTRRMDRLSDEGQQAAMGNSFRSGF